MTLERCQAAWLVPCRLECCTRVVVRVRDMAHRKVKVFAPLALHRAARSRPAVPQGWPGCSLGPTPSCAPLALPGSPLAPVAVAVPYLRRTYGEKQIKRRASENDPQFGVPNQRPQIPASQRKAVAKHRASRTLCGVWRLVCVAVAGGRESGVALRECAPGAYHFIGLYVEAL